MMNLEKEIELTMKGKKNLSEIFRGRFVLVFCNDSEPIPTEIVYERVKQHMSKLGFSINKMSFEYAANGLIYSLEYINTKLLYKIGSIVANEIDMLVGAIIPEIQSDCTYTEVVDYVNFVLQPDTDSTY